MAPTAGSARPARSPRHATPGSRSRSMTSEAPAVSPRSAVVSELTTVSTSSTYRVRCPRCRGHGGRSAAGTPLIAATTFWSNPRDNDDAAICRSCMAPASVIVNVTAVNAAAPTTASEPVYVPSVSGPATARKCSPIASRSLAVYSCGGGEPGSVGRSVPRINPGVVYWLAGTAHGVPWAPAVAAANSNPASPQWPRVTRSAASSRCAYRGRSRRWCDSARG
jgi:hypothetical protein